MLSHIFDDKDHFDWHRGIKEYGFWCVEVKNQNWLEPIRQLQSSLSPILIKDYQRFPHITLSAVGLMTIENQALVSKQLAFVKEYKHNRFRVAWQELSSYLHVPIVRVNDVSGSLNQFRHILHSVSQGDDSKDYDPHITLGYYAQEVDIYSVFNSLIIKVDQLEIDELLFCTYSTNSIKGPIHIRNRISLI